MREVILLPIDYMVKQDIVRITSNREACSTDSAQEMYGDSCHIVDRMFRFFDGKTTVRIPNRESKRYDCVDFPDGRDWVILDCWTISKDLYYEGMFDE